MSKQKFSITENIDCTGILDLNDEGDYVILVDGEEFDFVDVLKQCCGEQITLKCEKNL